MEEALQEEQVIHLQSVLHKEQLVEQVLRHRMVAEAEAVVLALQVQMVGAVVQVQNLVVMVVQEVMQQIR